MSDFFMTGLLFVVFEQLHTSDSSATLREGTPHHSERAALTFSIESEYLLIHQVADSHSRL
jgi:hypothetical protein